MSNVQLSFRTRFEELSPIYGTLIEIIEFVRRVGAFESARLPFVPIRIHGTISFHRYKIDSRVVGQCVQSIDQTSVTLCTELMSRAQLPTVSGEFGRYSSDGVIPAVLMSSLTRSTLCNNINILVVMELTS